MMHQPCKEEFSDWPNGLLTIGTFGNNNLKHSEKCSIQGQLHSGQDHLEPRDLEEVDKELIRLLNKHISLYSSLSDESEKHNNLSVEKFLDCLKEDEQKADELMSENKETRLQRSTSLVQRQGKIFGWITKEKASARNHCRFSSRRHSCAEEDSCLSHILRAMLHKKIYPQRPTPKNASKKYLDMAETDSDEEQSEEANRRSKWVKTDSESEDARKICISVFFSLYIHHSSTRIETF
ncbi:hypothetical protein Sango_1520300 [Sesamum angolense]|uniref:Uncharacterized protein n=1 Tax=Sesamum angolense TaxID=2727404 RepID=A0AAE1WPH1_9LAMI|nr:hypothetical protein Sango_1520300 [Sesamum angolense]